MEGRTRRHRFVEKCFLRGLEGIFNEDTVSRRSGRWTIFIVEVEELRKKRCKKNRNRTRQHQTVLRWLRVYLLHFYKFGSQGCCIPPSNSNKATDGAIETSRRTTRTDSQEPAPGTSMKPSYDPTKPWSRRRREFGASAQNGA